MSHSGSFPVFLREELGRRRQRHPRYSLRAFAQNLGVSSSFLSKVMAGKKSVGEETFLKMASRLDLEPEAQERFRAKLPGFKPQRLAFDPIGLDAFHYVSDWHHYAILEAVTLHGVEPTAQELSSRLNLSAERTRNALERLVRLGYLIRDSKGRISKSVKNLSTAHHPVPSAACREHERQVLELAIRALDEVPVELRDQTSVTLAIPSSRLAEAREKIDEFRREMVSLLQRRGKRDAVYHLSVSFYPVTALTERTTN